MGPKDWILAIFELHLVFNVNVNEEQMVQFTGLSECLPDILRQMVKFDKIQKFLDVFHITCHDFPGE